MKKIVAVAYVLIIALASTVAFGCSDPAAASVPPDTPIPLENPAIPPDPVGGSGPLLIPLERGNSSSATEGAGPIVASSLRSTSVDQPSARFPDAKQYMLDLINEERRKAEVPEVSLGDNNAAQIHAENSIRDCVSSHWGKDGLGPPMRHSLAGDYQSNRENVSGSDYCITDEERSRYRAIQSVQNKLRQIMNGYMNSTGHKNNILDPWHRKVNLGLAWDTHQMWNVQHFEGDYTDCSVPPTIEGTTLRVTCTAKEVFPSNLFAQQIFYDSPPHALTRGQLARVYGYSSGDKVALLREYAGQGYYWPTNETEVTHYSGCTPYDVDSTLPPPSSFAEANTLFNESKLCEPTETTVTVPWITGEETISGRSFTLAHDIGQVLTEHGSGVYTLVVWGCSVADSRDNPCEDDNAMVILEKSIFYGIEPPDTYTPAQASDSTPTPTATPTPTPSAPAPRVACGSAVTDTSNTALVADCEYLLGMKDTLRGSASLNWSASLPITGWTGVRLGGTPQRVTIVKLQKQNLTGSIPSGIGSLEKLQDLWLYTNELTGPLPAELGNLSELETLMLSNNNLSGQIPQTLNNLSLSRLWLKGNDFTGCMPANLLNVPDGDAASLNLPTCEGSPSPTPTPTPTGDDFDLTAYVNEAHCQAEDLSEAFGESYTQVDSIGPATYEHNGWGLGVFARSSWVNDNNSARRAFCITALYENVSSAIVDANYDRMRSLTEGSLDVLTQRKVRELPEIGHSFRALQIQLGEDRNVGTEDSLTAGVTVSMLRREHVVVFVGEIRIGNNVSPHLLQVTLVPPPVDGVVEISQRIDARLVALADTRDISAESLSGEDFSGSGFFDIAPTR